MTTKRDDVGQILVVDDNEANRYTVARLLRKAGFEVHEATDGLRGLKAANPDLDLIILDIRMPELDGYEVCRRLKADPRLSVVPVLHMSATYTATSDIAYGLEGGADGYLVHPVDPSVLLATVRAFLRLRRVDRALRASEALARTNAEELEAVMAAVPAAVMLSHDAAGRHITGNRATRELLRLPDVPDASMAGGAETLAAFRIRRDGVELPPDELPVQVAARTGAAVNAAELEIVFDDGSSTYVYGGATPLFDANGSVRGAVGAFVDITEERQIRAQLERVQRMESVGRLAGGIAHETNNQMLVALGLADYVLRGTNLTAEQRRDLIGVRRAADRVAQLTRQLLALSRRQVLRTEPVELDALVRESHSVLSRLLGPEFQLRLELHAAGQWVRADRTQLVQVMLNLAINARDAMPGGGLVTIATRTGDPPAAAGRLGRTWTPGTPVALLAVSDTGSGIDPTIRGRIFEPFFTTKPVGAGSGLGLSVVEGIVEQSNGEIWLATAPGAGTTFTLGFAVVPRPAPEPPEPSGAGGSETVLIVDDEAAVRRVLARQLADRGYDVLEASGGAEALEMMRDRGGDVALVVSDVAMPDMSGTELAKRARGADPMLPFIFVSGQPRETLVEYGDPASQGVLLEKPFSADVLTAAVRTTLDARASARSGGPPAAR
ncbi:MAG TPA: response regulator [Gemmatimonadales bacterium]|nr:response regulator [Gemmatimonadales bacterium]